MNPEVLVNSRERLSWPNFQTRVQDFPIAFAITGEDVSIGARRIEPNHRFPGYRYNLDIKWNNRMVKVNVILPAETLLPKLVEEIGFLRNKIQERMQQIETRRNTLAQRGDPLEDRFAQELEIAPRQIAFLNAFLATGGSRADSRAGSRGSRGSRAGSRRSSRRKSRKHLNRRRNIS